jgi:hypothetical protein
MRQRLARREVAAIEVNEATAPSKAPPAAIPVPMQMPSTAELYEMICEAAYYRAEKRGFTPGLEADDWVQAEAEVLERLRTRN